MSTTPATGSSAKNPRHRFPPVPDGALGHPEPRSVSANRRPCSPLC